VNINNCRAGSNTAIILIVIAVLVISAIGFKVFFSTGSAAEAEARARLCASRLRILSSAVELYNLDHAPLEMTELNQEELMKAGVLSIHLKCPDNETHDYKGSGLTKESLLDGTGISCEIHGNLKKIGHLLE